MFSRFTIEIRNKTIVEMFPAFSDLMSQNEYADRVRIDRARLSRLLAKNKGIKPVKRLKKSSE